MKTKFRAIMCLIGGLTALSALADTNCSDTRLNDDSIGQLRKDMTAAQVSALFGCEPSMTASSVDAIGRPMLDSAWTTGGISVSAQFVAGRLVTWARYGSKISLANPALFDAETNQLLLPALDVAGTKYANVRLALPPGGVWSILALNDAEGRTLPVPQTGSGGLAASGTLGGFAGAEKGTIIRFSDSRAVWQVASECSIPAPKPVTGTTGTVTYEGVQPNPLAYIFGINGTYVLTVVGSPKSCTVTPIVR